MKTTLLSILAAAVLFTNPAKAETDFDKVVGSTTYLTAYVMYCDGKLPPATRRVMNTVITAAGSTKMLLSFGKVDEEYKQIGTQKFCALVREVYADLL